LCIVGRSDPPPDGHFGFSHQKPTVRNPSVDKGEGQGDESSPAALDPISAVAAANAVPQKRT